MNQDPPPPPLARRGCLRGLLQCTVVLVALLAAGLFLARREIGERLAHRLDQRLAAEGIFVTWQAADWMPGPAIRFHGLALYRDAEKRQRLTLINHVTVTKGEPEWNRWDTVDVSTADAQLTLCSGIEETILEHLTLQLRIQPGSADLKACRASVLGLKLEAKGTYPTTVAKVDDDAEAASPGKGLLDDFRPEGTLRTLKNWLTLKAEKDRPVLKLEFHALPDGRGLDFDATLEGKRFIWRGQKWDSVNAKLETATGNRKSPVDVYRLRLGHTGRSLEMSGEYIRSSKVLRISKLESGLDLLAITRGMVPGATTPLTGLSTSGAWRVSGKGDIPLSSSGSLQWNGRVELDGDLIYTPTSKVRLAFQNPGCALRVDGDTWTATKLRAGLWDGTLDAPLFQVNGPSGKKKPRFELQIALRDAPLASAMGSFGPPQKHPGVVQFDWKGRGGFDVSTLAGAGTLDVREAEFFRLPLFGTLGRVLDGVTPGFGRDTSSRLAVTHRTTGGVVHLEDLVLDSQQVHIEGGGSINLKRQDADFKGEAHLKGMAGLATAPLRTVTDVTGHGPLGEVQWESHKKAGSGIVGGTAKAVGKTGGAVLQGSGKVLRGVGKGVKEVLKLPGKLLQDD